MNRLAKTLVAAVIASPLFAGAALSEEFSYDTVLPIYLKLDKSVIVDDLVDSYLQKYRPEVWQKYRNDEFELNEKRTETLKLMKDKIAAANPNTNFTILTNFTFGDYDFKTEKFAFTPFAQGLYFSVNYCCNQLPRQIDVSFLNPEIVDGIPMPKDAARQFLASRKSSYGDVDRKILAKINLVLKEYKGPGKLDAQIVDIELIDKGNKSLLKASSK